jgi:hypothetical protein
VATRKCSGNLTFGACLLPSTNSQITKQQHKTQLAVIYGEFNCFGDYAKTPSQGVISMPWTDVRELFQLQRFTVSGTV